MNEETRKQRYPDPDQRVAYGAMKSAFLNGDVEAFQKAMDAGDNPFYRHQDGETMLHYVISHGKNAAEMVEQLLLQGLDPDTPKDNGETPLLRAVQQGDTASLRVLLDYGADPSAQLDNGFGAYHLLSPETPPTIPRLLYRRGVDAQRRDTKGRTAEEHFAAQAQGFVFEDFEAWRERQGAVALPIQAGKPAKDILVLGGPFSRDDVSMASWKHLPGLLHGAKKEKQQLSPQGVAAMVATASDHGLLPQVMEVLHHNGFRLEASMLADAGGNATEVLERLAANRDLCHVFTQENMKGQTVGMVHAYRALPEAARGQVGNIHQLRLQCDEQDPERGR